MLAAVDAKVAVGLLQSLRSFVSGGPRRQKIWIFLDILTAMMGEYPKISIFSVF